MAIKQPENPEQPGIPLGTTVRAKHTDRGVTPCTGIVEQAKWNPIFRKWFYYVGSRKMRQFVAEDLEIVGERSTFFASPSRRAVRWGMDPLVVIALFLAVVYSPFWLPVAFGIYAVVNRRFTLRLLFVFITCECIALAFNLWLQGLLDDRIQ